MTRGRAAQQPGWQPPATRAVSECTPPTAAAELQSARRTDRTARCSGRGTSRAVNVKPPHPLRRRTPFAAAARPSQSCPSVRSCCKLKGGCARFRMVPNIDSCKQAKARSAAARLALGGGAVCLLVWRAPLSRTLTTVPPLPGVLQWTRTRTPAVSSACTRPRAQMDSIARGASTPRSISGRWLVWPRDRDTACAPCTPFPVFLVSFFFEARCEAARRVPRR